MTQLSHNVPQEETMIQLLTVLFPTAKIYLYGSRARGDHTERSDIDVAIDMGRKMELREVARARGVLEGLNTAQTIDVVDMHSIRADMRETILKEGVRWKN
jgi:predicted nucleotidyltransferase